MPASLTTKQIKDGAGSLFLQRVLDVSGTGAGPFLPVLGLVAPDGSGPIDLATLLAGVGATAGKAPVFNVPVTQLVRPANTTAYSANDSISNSATTGSVIALSCLPADVNDGPISIAELLLDTNDTGLAAGVIIRAWLYNSDPTASSGVAGGDNAAFSNKKAGFIGTMSGTFRAFADGGRARLVPDEGSFIVANPSTGGKTIWIQYQVLTGFTPSANSTTIDARLKGYQGRA